MSLVLAEVDLPCNGAAAVLWWMIWSWLRHLRLRASIELLIWWRLTLVGMVLPQKCAVAILALVIFVAGLRACALQLLAHVLVVRFFSGEKSSLSTCSV